MPTKRELRETEDTVQLDLDEIKKAEDSIDIPDFANKYYDERPYSKNIKPQKPDEEDAPDDRKPLIVGIVIFAVFLIISFSVIGCRKAKNAKQDKPEATPAVSEVETAEPTHEPTLDYFYTQQANTAIISKLNEEYGTDYTKPNTSQFKISGSEQSPSINFDLTVGDTFKKNYVMPAHFELAWDEESQKYTITDCSIDETEAVKSGFKSHTSKKESKKQAKAISEDGKEVSNFNVTVVNSVTVTITSKGSGTVTAYAAAEDGTKTKLASVSDGTTTKTVDLESGNYQLLLYVSDGTGYSWSYELG